MSHPSPTAPFRSVVLHSLIWLACAGMFAIDLPAWLALGAGWLASLALVWLLREARPETAQSAQPFVATPDKQPAQDVVDEHLGTRPANADQPANASQQAQTVHPTRAVGRSSRSKEGEWEEF